MTIPVSNDFAKALCYEAIEWQIRLSTGNWTADDQKAFDAWLQQSETHGLVYAEISRRMDWLERAAKRDTISRDQALRYRSNKHKIAMRRRAKLAAVASVLLVLGVATFSSEGWYGSSTQYSVLRGDHQTINLADGSNLELNTDTEIRVRLNHWQRSVEVIKGEVYFNVVPNAERPFVVTAGAGRSIDIGTKFDIYRQPQQVIVAVQEGSVRVEAKQTSELTATQSVAYDQNGEFVSIPTRQSVDSITAWRRGKLILDNRRLDEVLLEIGRYHNVQLRLSDVMLADKKVSGTFFIDRLEDNLATIANSLNLKIHHSGNGEIILAKQ